MAQLVPGAAAVASYGTASAGGSGSPRLSLPPSQVSMKACQVAACFWGCAQSNPVGGRTLLAAGRRPSRTRQSCFRSCWGPALRSQMACPHSRRRSGHGSLRTCNQQAANAAITCCLLPSPATSTHLLPCAAIVQTPAGTWWLPV